MTDEAVSDVWHMHDLGWGWWLLMSLGMVAFWALVLYGALWLARNAGPRDRDEQPRDESPVELLKRRLAAGEISVEEYERLRAAMGDGPAEHREPALH